MYKKLGFLVLVVGIFFIAFVYSFFFKIGLNISDFSSKINSEDFSKSKISDETDLHPLTIEVLRSGYYPGSEITIEQKLSQGSNYSRYIASYMSEGLKIFGLLTIPVSKTPESGFPVVIFNHGYINPEIYKTTEKYVSYQDAFARAGYVTFKSDYRGHGDSEGIASGGYGSNDYTIDVLNAVSSLKKLKDPNSESQETIVDPVNMGMWGHSMGGAITLKTMVVTKDIKAGVIWAGVVGSYPDLLERWNRSQSPTPIPNPTGQRGRWRRQLVEIYGNPQENPEFWNSISANSFLSEISGPLQLHHGTNDVTVPLDFSLTLEKQMNEAGKQVEMYVYEGDDHNLSSNLTLALRRSVEFFDKYLKQ